VIFVSSKKAFAARTTILSSPFGTDGSSAPKTRFLVCRKRCSILISSQSEIGANERLDFVKTIAATAENSQRKIDLSGAIDLHHLQFALSSGQVEEWSEWDERHETVAPRG